MTESTGAAGGLTADARTATVAAAPTTLAPSRRTLRAALRWGLLGFALIVVAQYVADAPGTRRHPPGVRPCV
jgi:hypothetical protein